MIEKAVLEELYLVRKLSMVEVAAVLEISSHKVEWWMKRYEIPRRNWREATYAKRNPNGDPFQIKTELNEKEVFLLGLGLGLYWGEGNKASLCSVRLGNSDPELIKQFINFLFAICQVKREKIAFALQIFGDIDRDEAVSYWQTQLNFQIHEFKPSIVVSPPQGKGTYKKKSKYGVLTVQVCNKKLRNWLVTQIIKLRQTNADIA